MDTGCAYFFGNRCDQIINFDHNSINKNLIELCLN